MGERSNHPSCCKCSVSSIAICVTCKNHFCWNHFEQHREAFIRYLDDVNQPLSACLNEFEHIETKLYAEIDKWAVETVAEVHKSADRARRSLDAYINSYRACFNDEAPNLRGISTANRDHLISRLEKLQKEYECSLKDLRLVKLYDRGQMLDVETVNTTREQVTVRGSSQISPQEADIYVAQTALGERLIREPAARTSVGSYWAMGGSNEHLLMQEYENNLLTLFDRHGTRGASMTWHYDLAIRDIIWYEESKQFFLLLDKKLILFDPVTKHFQDIAQVKPYQSNAFRRCDCRHDRLFIAYWGQESLVELIRMGTWETEQRWLSPVTCHVNEAITCIRLNSNDQIGLCIQDENNPLNRKFRFEIRDVALNILHRLPLHVDSGIFSRMVALPDLHWALLNVDETFVFVVDQHGALIDKIDWPRGRMSNIALISDNTITIRTDDKVYFYDVNFHA
ncbi:unnamed protein product [Adineta ricciae]|uniref:Uncharacterized protein n=1 Tax=Adineta ricciae TaxID=249248 RepID=A0A815ZND0_ADIRI|nr:unnamed protein product [Adineta ricciae]CAF1585416.1 unnamed protein product [Adineta ricciae]